MGLPSGFIPSGFPTISPYVLHVMSISFFLTWSSEWYLVRSAEHKSHYVVLSTPLLPRSSLGPNILLSILFSKTLNQHSFLNVSDQVPQPRKTTGKNIVLYILIFIFWGSKVGEKRFCTEW
jgi:hypothetical protein